MQVFIIDELLHEKKSEFEVQDTYHKEPKRKGVKGLLVNIYGHIVHLNDEHRGISLTAANTHDNENSCRLNCKKNYPLL